MSTNSYSRSLFALLALCSACGDDGNTTPSDAGVDAPADAPDDPDLTAPTIVATTPGDTAAAVVPSTPITVTFSEAMDPATITDATITLSPPTAATVTWDEASLTATLTPSAPLHRAVTYTLSVAASAADLAGNTLVEPFTAAFSIETAPATRIDTGGKAIPLRPKAAYDGAGNGVIVWGLYLGEEDYDLYYATYTAATNTWSPEIRLAGGYQDPPRFELESNGTTFALLVEGGGSEVYGYILAYDADASAWEVSARLTVFADSMTELKLLTNGTTYLAVLRNISQISVRLYNGALWTGISVLTSSANEFSAATDGDAYAVAWIQSNGSSRRARVAVYEADAWTAAVELTEPSAADNARAVDIAGAVNQTGFVLGWTQKPPAQTGNAVYVARYVRSNGTSTVEGPAALTDSTERAEYVRVAAGANGTYGVLYEETNDLRFIPWNGTSWGAAEEVANNVFWDEVQLVRAGPRYAAIWRSGSNAIARVRTSGTWEPPYTLTSPGYSVTELAAAATSTFGIVHSERSATGSARVVRTLYQAQTSEWAAGVVVSSAMVDVASPFINRRGNTFVTAWTQDGDVAMRAGGGLELRTTMLHPSSAQLYDLVASEGRSLAVWTQPAGTGDALFASIHDGGLTWSAPALLAYGKGRPRTASRAGTFMVADEHHVYFHDGAGWQETTETSGLAVTEVLAVGANDDGYLLIYGIDGEIYAATTTDGVWTELPAPPVSGLWSDPFLVPSKDGFLFGWHDMHELNATRFDGSTWSGVDVVGTGIPDPDRRRTISNGVGYLVAWPDDDHSERVYASVFDGTSWTTSTLAELDDSVEGLAVASNGATYAVMWRTNGRAGAATYAGDWSTGHILTTSSHDNSGITLASDAAGYLAMWFDDDRTGRLAGFDGTQWNALPALAGKTDMRGFAVRGDRGYRLGVLRTVANHIELQVHRLLGDEISDGAPVDADVLDDQISPVSTWNGRSASAVWARPVSNVGRVRGVYGTGAL